MEDLVVKMEVLKDGKVTNTTEVKGFVGVVFVPCKCGREGCFDRVFMHTGQFGATDVALAKHIFAEGIQEILVRLVKEMKQKEQLIRNDRKVY